MFGHTSSSKLKSKKPNYMNIKDMDNIIRNQVSIELSEKGMTLVQLKEFEKYKELYEMALKLLVELRGHTL